MMILTCKPKGTRFYLSSERLATDDVTRGQWFKTKELAEQVAKEENRLPTWHRFGFHWIVEELN